MASNRSKLNLILLELKYLLFKQKYIAMVDVTNRCNLRCKHCYQKEHLSLEDNNTLKQWQERFEEYYKMGIRYIGFVGGEPSLRYDVLRLAENYFPFVEVYTNGQIKIPEEFNRRIFLSLEGLEEEHNEICGRGAFKIAVNNYWGDKRIVVYTTLFKMNYKGPQRLKEFIDFVRKMGVRGIRFSFYAAKKGEDENLFLNNFQHQEIREVLLEELRRKDSILLMTRGAINFLSQPHLLFNKCAYKERTYNFDYQNKRRRCFNSEIDCSKCLSLCRYAPLFYEFKEWLSYNRLVYKSLP